MAEDRQDLELVNSAKGKKYRLCTLLLTWLFDRNCLHVQNIFTMKECMHRFVSCRTFVNRHILHYGFISIKNMWLYSIEITDLANFVPHVHWKIKNG